MNLFVLAVLASEAAKYHCDKHCIKMILEVCQLLYTAHWFGRTSVEWAPSKYPPYKPTHKNHPCAIWVRADKSHYDWALDLGLELCQEYTHRYDKIHKCETHLNRLKTMGYPELIGTETYEPPAKKRATFNTPKGCDYFHVAIADELFEKCAVYQDGELDCVETYRNYYKTKPWKLQWNRGKDNPPWWFSKPIDTTHYQSSSLTKPSPECSPNCSCQNCIITPPPAKRKRTEKS